MTAPPVEGTSDRLSPQSPSWFGVRVGRDRAPFTGSVVSPVPAPPSRPVLGRIVIDPGPGRTLTQEAHTRIALVAAHLAMAATGQAPPGGHRFGDEA